MKNIPVSDEMYSQLVELSKQMNEQNHRGTAMPYFFQVREIKRIDGVHEDYSTDGYVWISGGGDGVIESDVQSMKDALDSDGVDFDKEIDEDGLDKLMDENGYYKGHYRNQEVLSNAFLTEKSCKEHIEANSYHYSQPADYLSHAFRNPDMELISKFLCELTGGEIHK